MKRYRALQFDIVLGLTEVMGTGNVSIVAVFVGLSIILKSSIHRLTQQRHCECVNHFAKILLRTFLPW